MQKEKLIITKKAAICRFFFYLFFVKKNTLSYDEIKSKAQNYCAYQERCHMEVENKLRTYSTSKEEIDNIIYELIKNNYLNETRFAQAFSRGKFKFKNWGKMRIKMELEKRKVSKKNIDIGMNEINEEDYIKKLDELFQKCIDKFQKYNKQQMKKKIFDYLNYRGWEYDKIFNKLNEL
jgi:regulatory protein